MPNPATSILDLPHGQIPDPDEYVQAAMEWHFNPETGSPYWLNRAESLDFDPRKDVKSIADLTLFPNDANELRDVPARHLVPQGYGPDPEIIGVYESGGTTGAPKRVVYLADWMRRHLSWVSASLDAHGFPRGADWLAITPSGPHIIAEMYGRLAAMRGGIMFSIDLDPRWVKKLIAARNAEQAGAYTDHLVEQALFTLRTQDVGVLLTTPPLLERLARHEEIADLIGRKVRAIEWAGTHMDADTLDLLKGEVFPGSVFHGFYGSTMILGGATERLGLGDDDLCTYDPHTPYITFSVVDEETMRPVGYDERGQVIMNHVSKSFLLPNNLERDLAVRVPAPEGGVGDSVADVGPVATFDHEAVIEGVY